MLLFEYADLVWGDKHNVTLMSSLQVLQNKAAKIILDRPLYSSASDALTTLKWLTLEKRRFQRRCIHVYKCLNGLTHHELTLVTQQKQHSYNTRNKANLKIPSIKRNNNNNNNNNNNKTYIALISIRLFSSALKSKGQKKSSKIKI